MGAFGTVAHFAGMERKALAQTKIIGCPNSLGMLHAIGRLKQVSGGWDGKFM